MGEEVKYEYIELCFTDIHGAIKSTTIPFSKFEESQKRGTWFDGSSIEGFTRIAESDMFLKPDTEIIKIPWKEGVGMVMCDVYSSDGKQFEGDPRSILKRARKQARRIGFVYNVGPELEFFLFKSNNDGIKPLPHDSAGYFDASPSDLADNIMRETTDVLEEMKLDIEMLHHEVAHGQHEIDFKYGDALITADRAIILKQVVKSVSSRH